MVSGTGDNPASITTTAGRLNFNAATGVLTTTATRARYADLAENYLADDDYETGTVLVVGGNAEVTQSTEVNAPNVAGVISEKPSYLMNTSLEGTHIATVALRGRVPCKVIGAVRKGQILISSNVPGYAVVSEQPYSTNSTSVVGIALHDKLDSDPGIVEILV